jgi:hypothetical protein
MPRILQYPRVAADASGVRVEACLRPPWAQSASQRTRGGWPGPNPPNAPCQNPVISGGGTRELLGSQYSRTCLRWYLHVVNVMIPERVGASGLL